MSKIWYCSTCGSVFDKPNANCSKCNAQIRLKRAKQELECYQKQYLEKYEHQTNKFGEYEDLLNGSNLDEWYFPLFIEEIRLSGCFNPNLFKEHNNRKAHIAKTKSTQYIPKCPVCQSPKIEKISTADRIVHGATFGLYSKTARSQWRCNNCGNLW